MKKAFYILSGILIGINLYWVFATPLLPFIDLPFHLAESFVVKNFGNPDFLFGRYYAIPSFIKSNTFHTFFCASGVFGNPETANKIYYAIYVVLLPLSVFYLLRTLGGNVYFSLLSFFFTINYSVHWGFTGYTMSVPVLFFLFAVYYKYFIRRLTKFVLALPPFLILLFLLHFQTAIFALLVFGILQIIYAAKSVKYWGFGLLAVIPVAAVMFLAYDTDSAGGTSLTGFLFNYYMIDYAGSVPARLGLFFIFDNFFLFKGPWGSVYAALVSSSAVILFILTLRKKYKEASAEKTFIYVILIISALCYLFLPDNINGQNIIYERYSVITLLLLITASGLSSEAISPRLFSKLAAPVFIILLFLHAAVITDYMNDFRKESRDFSKELFSSCGKSLMAGVIKDNDFRGRKVWTHFPMYYTLWNGGVTTGLIDYKFGLIKRKVPKEILPQYIEWTEGREMDYGRYYTSAGYIITKCSPPIILNGFENILSAGEWKLYRNIHALTP